MHALTIQQPWAACIAHGPKRVENRTWFPPRKWRLPMQLAIHSSKRHAKTDEAYKTERIAEVWPDVREAPRVRGAVLAVATLVRVVRYNEGDLGWGPWAMGPWCWMLEDVRTLAEPVFCTGRQSLWPLPHSVEARVLEQLGAS
jgi:hypothetical protein